MARKCSLPVVVLIQAGGGAGGVEWLSCRRSADTSRVIVSKRKSTADATDSLVFRATSVAGISAAEFSTHLREALRPDIALAVQRTLGNCRKA